MLQFQLSFELNLPPHTHCAAVAYSLFLLSFPPPSPLLSTPPLRPWKNCHLSIFNRHADMKDLIKFNSSWQQPPSQLDASYTHSSIPFSMHSFDSQPNCVWVRMGKWWQLCSRATLSADAQFSICWLLMHPLWLLALFSNSPFRLPLSQPEENSQWSACEIRKLIS